MQNTVHIFFTGGWDSTFRLLQLAENDIVIKPVYLIDEHRKSQEYELKAMNQIIEEVRVSSRFKATISDIKFYEIDWILKNCQDEKISTAFRYLKEKYNIGTQWEWLALLAQNENIKFESAVVHQYHGKVEEAIQAEGILENIPNDFLTKRKHVLPKENNDTAYRVFGNLILSVIDLTKEDEGRIAKEKGWLEIMELTWFCHSPINGKPCGLCSPCDDAMNTGMEWRMPAEAKWRYSHKNKIWFKIWIKMCKGVRHFVRKNL